ncbi:hypothetical protein RRG08_007896 [Elysia crispata]|uniref:Uncharacterized protein n=1 Tax=Elysia crispata TaxID=231223 RepID=A0AAE0XWQ3_9GAST|nr:hypothetical protein RRG08_007896 [Elysia crispata]
MRSANAVQTCSFLLWWKHSTWSAHGQFDQSFEPTPFKSLVIGSPDSARSSVWCNSVGSSAAARAGAAYTINITIIAVVV